MALATSKLYPADSSLADGRLRIGGCYAVELAHEFGTPAYVVAEGDLRARAREFTAALAEHHDGPGDVVYASKAFPATAVLRLFAEEGLAWGFHNRLAEDVLAEAQALARSLADGPNFAHGITKTQLNNEWAVSLETAIEMEAQAQAICMATGDFRRAFEAFASKKVPEFRGD